MRAVVKTGLASVLSLLVSMNAWAAVQAAEITVRGAYDNQDIYVVAYPNPNGISELEPGIYALKRGNDKPTLVLKGQVLGAGRGFNGVLQQSVLTANTLRYESFAVINEKLVLFSNKSRSNNPSSFIVFGSKSNPIVDVLNRRPVDIDPITKIDDVNVVLGTVSRYTKMQMALISIRQPSAPFGGKGITFAVLMVPPSAGESPTVLHYSGAPVVIDYDFYSGSELQRLFHSKYPQMVLSPAHLLHHIPAAADDDRILTEWRRDIGALLKKVKRDGSKKTSKVSKDAERKAKRREATIPYYDLAQSKVHLDQLPHALLAKSPMLIYQITNPVHGSGSGLILNANKSQAAPDDLKPGTHPTAPGRVDYNEKTGTYQIYPIESETAAVLAIVDGKSALFFQNGRDQIARVEIHSFLESDFRQFHGHHRSVEILGDGAHTRHYFFISRHNRDSGPQTDVLVIDERDGIVKYERKLTLNKRIMTEREMRGRVVALDGDSPGPEHGHVLFDNITSVDRILNSRSKKETTTPLLNLSRTTTMEKPEQTYLQYLDHKNLVEHQMEYRYYDPQGIKESKSGFYIWKVPNVVNDPKAEYYFVPGEIVYPENDKSASVDLDAKILSQVGAEKANVPDFRVSAVAFNPEPGRKIAENKFSVLFHVGSASSSDAINSGFKVTEVPGPISRLVGAKLVQGRKGNSLNISLLLFFKSAHTKNSRASERGGVYAVNFTIAGMQIVNGNSRIGSIQGGWLEREEVRPDQIRHRLVWDTPGQLYWILNPARDRHDRGFKVRKIAQVAEAEVLFPNLPGRRINLRHDQGMGEEENYDSLFRTHSRWLIYSKQDLEELSPVLKEYFEELEKKKKDGKSLKEKNLFPQFSKFLDLQAQDKQPTTHQVLLVEAEHKDVFLKALGKQMADSDGSWSLKNLRFSLYGLDVKVDDKEMRDELDKIAKPGDGRKLLLADLGKMLEAQGVEVEHVSRGEGKEEAGEVDTGAEEKLEEEVNDDVDKESEKASDGDEEAEVEADAEGSDEIEELAFKTSMMMVLATEGDKVPLKKFKARSKLAPRVPMLIIATPAEWRALQDHYNDEARAGVFNSFNVNAQFLTSSWSVWSPESGKATDEVAKASQAPISADEYSVLPNLEKMLLDSTNINSEPKHRLIVIPDELKVLVRRLILARWASSAKSIVGPWSHTNSDLALFQVNQNGLSQELLEENFEAMRGANQGRRPVLLGDMGDILKVGRPVSESGHNSSFAIRDPASSKSGQMGLDSTVLSSSPKQIPHLMWWLMTEGKRIQPQRAKGWTIEQSAPPEIPMLIFASPNELAQLKAETDFESRFVDIEKQFKIEALEIPSEQTRNRLVDELFNNPKIASLQYEFQHNDLPQKEARRQLVGVMVNRVEQIARGQGQEPTSAFLKAYLELKRQLTEDPRLRQEKKLDRFFFERLYRRVFNMPLSFDILTKDDPLRKLQDIERAAIGLQERGYEGSTELKRQILETVTSQTKGADEGRPIPSSTILIGSTSTGKTFLYKTMIKYMGLKEYDFARPMDDQASAFTINLASVSEAEDPSNPGRLSVQQVIQHLEHFLSLPNGSRGFILIDDAHKGSPEVRKVILQYLQGFFETPGGMKRVRRLSGEIVEIPVRNLSIFMTLNPQPDREIRKRYIDEWDADIDKEIIAALAGEGVQIDESFVARWSTKLNMDSFPREAKLPTLVTRIRAAAQQEFSSHPRLMLVTPPVLDQFVTHFPDANAREFLSSATYSMLSLDNDLAPAPIYLVQPNIERREEEDAILDSKSRDKGKGGEKINTAALREFLKKITIVRPIRVNDIGSQIYLTSFVVDSFRSQVYNWLITSGQRMPELSSTRQLRTRDMAAFFLGIVDNLSDFPSVPLDRVRLQPDQYAVGLKPSQIAEFNEAVAKNSARSGKFFRFDFQSAVGDANIELSQFIDSTYVPKKRGRLDVLAETAGEIQKILAPLMAAYFRVPDVNGNLDLQAWGQSLTDAEPKEAFIKASQELIRLYLNFGIRLFEDDLKEMAKDSGYGQLNLTDYDRVRLFMMCLDKALTQLPWGRMTKFTLQTVDASVNDLSWGMRPAIQHLYFKSTYSPLSTLTPELVVDMANASRDFREFRDQVQGSLRLAYEEKCDNILIADTVRKEGRK